MCDYVCKFQIYLYIYTASLYSGENLLDSGAIHIARFWGNIHVYMNMNLGGYIYTTLGKCTICMYMYIYICKYINMYMRILDLNISLDFGGSCMSLASGGIYIFMYVHTNTCDYARILQKKYYMCVYQSDVLPLQSTMWIYTYVLCMLIGKFVYIYVNICTFICVGMCACLYTHVCVCVCVYIYIYAHACSYLVNTQRRNQKWTQKY